MPVFSNPIHHNPKASQAHAPYNFVRLPEKIVEVDEPRPHNSYTGGVTGTIVCKMRTLTPTYVRGILTPEDYRRLQDKDITAEQKKALLTNFFSLDDEKADGLPKPTIPGSSIRGMLRNIIEVVTFSKLHSVADEPPIFFRDVAGSGGPYKDLYKKHIYREVQNSGTGREKQPHIKGGFIRKRDGKLWIQPAPEPKSIRGLVDQPFIKLDNKDLERNPTLLQGFIRLYQPGYAKQPPYRFNFFVKSNRYNARVQTHHGTRTFPMAENLVIFQQPNSDPRGMQTGWIIPTGNMVNKPLERLEERDKRRRYHAVILDADKNDTANWYEIDEFAIKYYVNNLTDFILENIGLKGCLIEDRPVFFLPPNNGQDKVKFFGHNPYFRIPIMQGNRVVTPRDFVPEELLDDKRIDFCDAIFGWVEEGGKARKNPGTNSGRVSFLDATLDENQQDIWYKPLPQTPKILGSPKPTSFTHYLVQDKTKGHDPDEKWNLANYCTPKKETAIRGHKFYWAQGENPAFTEAQEERSKEKLYTRINAVKDGVGFSFSIKFSNLTKTELGALLWALSLGGKNSKARHRIGMGKPLGMGVVEISHQLKVSDRKKRYKQLFSIQDYETRWFEPEEDADDDKYLSDFENFMRDQLDLNSPFIDCARIQELLKILSWSPDEQKESRWCNTRKYMTLEDFRQKRVLPPSLDV